MQITCPSCNTTFKIDEGLVRSPSQKMRCSRCGHLFVYHKGEQAAPEPKHEQAAAEKAEPVAARTKPTEASVGKKKTGLTIIVIAIVVLLAAAAGVYYYWMEYLGVADKWLRIQNLQGQEMITREGKVFFISGSLFNGSTKPRKYIIVRTRLFDKDAKPIAEKDMLAGLSLPREELVSMWRLELEKKINDFKQSKPDTFVVPAGKEKPFSVVFFDDGLAQAREYQVEIIESPRL